MVSPRLGFALWVLVFYLLFLYVVFRFGGHGGSGHLRITD